MQTRTWMTAVITTILLASPSWGAGFSANPAGIAGQAGGGIVEGGCGATVLTQSTSQTIVALEQRELQRQWPAHGQQLLPRLRHERLPGRIRRLRDSSGCRTGRSFGGTQPITVNVYANTGGTFPAGALVLLGTAPVSVADQSLTVLDVPLAASVPAGTTEMVLEVFTPNGQASGNGFFIGTNDLGQSGLSYIEAPDCNVLSPTPTGDIGFPNMHIVLNAVGDEQIAAPPVEVPALGGWG